MSRGNRRTRIFEDKEDYQTFISLLARAQKLFPFFLISYCLMTNHIHLQIETIDHSPSKIMHCLLSNYSRYFNTKYEYVGHLFQGRFLDEIINNDSYFLTTSKYIHLNPVKANIVDNPIEYPWSSYSVLMDKKTSDLINKEKILEYYNGDIINQIGNYKDFVENKTTKDEISDEVSKFEDKVMGDSE